jgi:hypothetical protein
LVSALHVVIGIPITVFMLVWAITMPLRARCDRIGYRLAASALAHDDDRTVPDRLFDELADLLLWRSITAVGYGIVYVTTQAYITASCRPRRAPRAGDVPGELFHRLALRGRDRRILVDRLACNDIPALCRLERHRGAYVLRSLGDETGRTVAKKAPSLADFKLLVRHKHFAIVTFLSAVPAKVALAGFLYYSVPLYLKGLAITSRSPDA